LERRVGRAESFALFTNLEDPEEKGIGLLEYVVAGPYPGIDEVD
jgi:hypothetical protein